MAKVKRSAVAALSGSPSHLLHRALQLALDIYAEEAGKTALTQRQYAVLAATATVEGSTQTDLVRMTGIDRSTLADMLTRMIAKGWLARERSAMDARAKVVALTPRGRTALDAIAPRVEAADARILAHLSSARRASFVAALGALSQAGETALLGEAAERPKGKAKIKSPKPAKKPKAKRTDADGKTGKKKKKKARKAREADDAAEV